MNGLTNERLSEVGKIRVTLPHTHTPNPHAGPSSSTRRRRVRVGGDRVKGSGGGGDGGALDAVSEPSMSLLSLSPRD